MYNKVILVGNVTRDIELRYTATGTPVAKMGLATNRRYRDRATGEQKEETLFIDVTIFGKSAEVVNQYCGKGRRVLVEGRLAMDQWVAPDGTKRTKHYVVAEVVKFMDSRGDSGEFGPRGGGVGFGGTAPGAPTGGEAPFPPPPPPIHQQPQPQPQPTPEPPTRPTGPVMDEDLPF